MDIGEPVRRHRSVPAPAGPDHVPEVWPTPAEPVREPERTPAPAKKEPVKTPA